MADPFVVIGYVPSKTAAGIVGSLVLGYYENGEIVYAGRVGPASRSPRPRHGRCSSLDGTQPRR